MSHRSSDFQRVSGRVRHLLDQYPHYRDNNMALSSHVLFLECQNRFTESELKTLHRFLKLYAEGKLPSHESITRESRQIQKDCPELRGLEWGERQKHAKNISRQKVKK